MTGLTRYRDLAGTQLVGTTTITPDDARRITSVVHKDSTSATISSYSYQYDNANRLTQETTTTFPGGDPSISTTNYTYDQTDQLTSEGFSTWTYDKNGNRTNSGYVTGTGNRLSTDGTWNYTYDDEGNVIKKVKIVGGETWNYSYNHLNQMTRVEKHSSDGGPLTQLDVFKYDVLGNRIEKSFDDDGSGPHAAVITRYAYEGPNAWADLDSSNNLTMRRLYLDAVDAAFARIAADGPTAWYLTDRLGSIRDIVDNTGAPQDHISYSAWGGASDSVPSWGDRYKFTGREYDSELDGLAYYRGRYYRFNVGLWQSEDPIRFAAGDANLYRYVHNSPTNATDPSGFLPVLYVHNLLTTPPEGLLPVTGPWGWADRPLPPGWNPSWSWGPWPGSNPNRGWRWFDPWGGQWRWHPPDTEHHPQGHWDVQMGPNSPLKKSLTVLLY